MDDIARSQITSILHPSAAACCFVLISRCRFHIIFSSQKSRLVLGQRNREQSWPCQKHPCTKTSAWCFRSTRSGVPGRRLSWRVNQKPKRCRADRTAFSERVFRDFTRAISRARALFFRGWLLATLLFSRFHGSSPRRGMVSLGTQSLPPRAPRPHCRTVCKPAYPTLES